MLLLTGRAFAVSYRHVLGVLKGPTVQEEHAFGRLLLLQTVQREVHTEVWTRVRSLMNIKCLLHRHEGRQQAKVYSLRVEGAPRPLAFRQYFTLKLSTHTRDSDDWCLLVFLIFHQQRPKHVVFTFNLSYCKNQFLW